jgi:uncharacterized protein with GYD domain
MPHYLFQATYTQKGLEGTKKDGAASRIPAFRQLFESLGGRLESAYWAFGEADIIIIGELPDNVAAVASSMLSRLAGTGAIRTTVLLTAVEIDEAFERDLTYRSPGE